MPVVTTCLCWQVVKLRAFNKFENTTEALAAASALLDGKLSKGEATPGQLVCCISQPSQGIDLHLPAGLKKFLKKNATGDTVAVADSKLGNIVKEKLGIPCIYKCGSPCQLALCSTQRCSC